MIRSASSGQDRAGRWGRNDGDEPAPDGRAALAVCDRPLNYTDPGVTDPASPRWAATDGRYRIFEQRVPLGTGEDTWKRAAVDVMAWKVKTQSGFVLDADPPSIPVCPGASHWLTAHVGPLRIREPIRIIATVDDPDRCGFSYGTLRGHPVAGEDAFLVERTADGTTWFVQRSASHAPNGWWRIAYPATLAAQPRYRRRYARALA